MTRFERGLGSASLWEGAIDEFIELRVYTLKRGSKREWKNGILAGEDGDCGPENTGLQTFKQARDRPALRSD